MAQLERLQKSLEALKIVQVTSRLEKLPFDKAHPPIRLLKQEVYLGKNEFIQHCNIITECICTPLIRNLDEFPRFLALACETLLILCDDDDTDIRLVASDSLDKICLAYESNLSRIIYEFYREIEKNASSRSLRVALNKFADLVGFIRPAKYRAYITKLFPAVGRIAGRTDDELLQETLYSGFLAKVAPTLAPYASEREITVLLNAYLPSLNAPANLVRRSAALALVSLCVHSRRPQFCFKWLLGNSLNMLSLVKVSTTNNNNTTISSESGISSERIFSGIFVLAKFLVPKVMKLLDTEAEENVGIAPISAEDYEILFDNMIFLYQHLLTSLKYSSSNVVIVAALDALLEFIISMPAPVYRRILSLSSDHHQQSATPSSLHNINLSRSPTAFSGGYEGGTSSSRLDRRYESNLSITSSINYIENINDEGSFTAGDLESFTSSSERQRRAQRHSSSANLVGDSSGRKSSSGFDDRRSVTTADGAFAGAAYGSEFGGDSESNFYFGADDAVFSDVLFGGDDLESTTSESNLNSDFDGTSNQHRGNMLNDASFEDVLLSETQYSSFDRHSKSPLFYPELLASEGGDGVSETKKQGSGSTTIDQFNLGPLYSLEYAAKLLCLKYLLTGKAGQLIPDEAVRVSIKSLALSALAALVHVYPEALMLTVECEEVETEGEDENRKTLSQSFTDVLLYATHSDPNLKGCVAQLLGKFFDRLLSYPVSSYSELVGLYFKSQEGKDFIVHNFGSLFSVLCRIASDQSTAISVKQAISSFGLFLPKLMANFTVAGSGELTAEELLDCLRELISLKDNPYWLVKVELVGLLAKLPYNGLVYLEKQNSSSSKGQQNLQRVVLEEVVLPFSLDSDHRVRQATVNCLGLFVENLSLNSYLLNSDPVNVATFSWMLANYHQTHSSGLFCPASGASFFPDTRTVGRPLELIGGTNANQENDSQNQMEATFSLRLLGQLQHSLRSSNLHFFVRHYVQALRGGYQRKQSLAGIVTALATLSKKYPPSAYPEAWSIGSDEYNFELSPESGGESFDSGSKGGLSTATLLVELLSKNQTVLLDSTTHQQLLTLTTDLLEGIVCAQAKKLQDLQMKTNFSRASVPTSEAAFFASISPHFSSLTAQLFLHLLKVLVAHAAIAEDNSAIFVTFIHNLHSKHHSHHSNQLSSLLKSSSNVKRTATSGGKSSFGSRERPPLLLEPTALKKELASKGSKKMEAFAYDPLYHRLFEHLRSYHRNKKSSLANKSEKYALLSTTLGCMGQLLEIIDPHSSTSNLNGNANSITVFHLLEDILVYLRLVFDQEPTATVSVVRQLLKCAFTVNYVSLFVDLLSDQLVGKFGQLPFANSSSNSSSTTANTAFKCEHMNSLYNSCLSMPYIRLNEYYNACQRARSGSAESAVGNDGVGSTGFLTWLRERTQAKLGKTLNLSSPSSSARFLSDSEMKSLLTAKIQLLEPLVVKCFKLYTAANDRRFQASVAELLAQLVQLQVNFCSLDPDNVFIGCVLKQFEFLENVSCGTKALTAAYEPLMRRLFYFLVILSNGRYVSEELVDLPKVIQLCDAFIANGHHQMAVQGLAIVVDDCFYFKGRQEMSNSSSGCVSGDLEATREVVLAFAFKLLDHHTQAFDLLTMIATYYSQSSRARWATLSATIFELLLPKFLIDSGSSMRRLINCPRSFECLQTLVYRLCPAVFTGNSSSAFNLPSFLFKSCRGSGESHDIKDEDQQTSLWQTLLFLRLIITNLNEAECLAKTEEIKDTIDFVVLGSNEGGDSKSASPEELIAALLLGVLQQTLNELSDDLSGYHKSTFTTASKKSEFTVYLLAQYSLSLAFIFQSGFFPKITHSATEIIGRCRMGNQDLRCSALSDKLLVNDLPYDFATTNGLFFKLATFYPHLAISWLNLLYITNFERLPAMLASLIEQQPQKNSGDLGEHDLPQSQPFPAQIVSSTSGPLTSPASINATVLRRFALVLFCDYLTENLETSVEYLSWLVINHLREVIDICYEVPVKEFIHSVHRKSSSSGLFLQAVNSRLVGPGGVEGGAQLQLASDPLFASKLLHCLERAHSSQSLPLVVFLLEQYLFNKGLAPYYNCAKAAETIAASRLASLYDLNRGVAGNEIVPFGFSASETAETVSPLPPKNLLTLKDLSNLRRLLRGTSYVKLSYTVQTIKNQYFSSSGRKKSSSASIKDPLTASTEAARNADIPEINKRWFVEDILTQYWSVTQRSTANAVHFLNKLPNEDIVALVSSDRFSLVNLKQILVYLVENEKKKRRLAGGHFKAAAAHRCFESSSREELAKAMLTFCHRLMLYTVRQCPSALGSLLKERQFLLGDQFGELEDGSEAHFQAVAFSFLPPFEFLVSNLPTLEAVAGCPLIANSEDNIDIDLLLLYATLIPPTLHRNALVPLIDLLTLMKSALQSANLSSKIGRPENIHVQSALIRCIYFLVDKCFTLNEAEIQLPPELTAFGSGSEQFEKHIFADIRKTLVLFHWLEESVVLASRLARRRKRKTGVNRTLGCLFHPQLPPVMGRLLEEIVIGLAQLPLVNSLVYLPYSLFAPRQVVSGSVSAGQHSFWKEASFNGDFHTCTPIIGAHHLGGGDLDLFRSFARRIELLGYVNRVQFEEIWMTLLGVFSDNLTYMSLQAKQPSANGELNDSLQLGQLVVRSVTTLLLTAANKNKTTSSLNGSPKQTESTPRSFNNRRPSATSSFGDRFELIRECLSQRSAELEEMLSLYNSKSSSPFSGSFGEATWDGLRSSNSSRNTSKESSPTGEQVASLDTSVDLYSCLHFLIDLYLQTVQVLTTSGANNSKDQPPTSTTSFPVFAEIAKSALAVSSLFTEKTQYSKLLSLLHELARIVDVYEDELLNQAVIVGISKTHAVLGFSDETIEKAKKLILEQHFKDFFLPTRIGAVRSVKYLLQVRQLPLTTKELAPVCDYIAKHFTNDHCIPSSYSAEYVEELWSLSLALVARTSVPSLAGDFNDKVVKGLLRSLSKCGGSGGKHAFINVQSVCACLEQLLFMNASNSFSFSGSSSNKSEAQASKELVVAVHGTALKQLKVCSGQLNTVSLLRLYVLASYLVGPGSNFPGRYQVKSPSSAAASEKASGGDDELFSSMEQLSVIFEPLKGPHCNSLQAATLCAVMGHFLVDFFPAQDLLNKAIGEFLSNQQNHYKSLTDILFVIFNKFQNDFHHNDTAQEWVLLSLSSFTQLVPISHALWALTCFLMAASQNHWIRASYPYFQHRFGRFNERDKGAFFTICNNFYNEIKSEENKRAFIKTFQKAACLSNSPYFDVLKYLCDI